MPKTSSRRRQAGWMSILIQGANVTLAHVIQGRDQPPELRLLDHFAMDKGEVEALQRLCATRRLKSYACTTLMPTGECTVTQLDAPPVPQAERKEAVRWLLKEVVAYPVDTACIEVLEIPGDGLPPGRSPGILAVSAAEQAVRARVAAFEQAKIRIDALDVPELAQRNVAALLEEENRGIAFLRLDENGLMLTLTFHGELIAVRRGEISSLHLSDGSEEQRARARERLALELQRSLDNFDRQYSHIPIAKVVVACHPPADGLIAEFAENSYVPVVNMDLSSCMNLSAVPELKNPQHQAKHLLSLGAALRTDGVAS